MFFVILDTNSLHKEGYFSHDMLKLGRLISEGKAKIILPTLVKREFLSKKQNDLFDHIKKSTTGLENARRFFASKDLEAELTLIETQINTFSINASEQIEAEFTKWAGENNVELIDFDPPCTLEVFNDYFS